jgi:G patch domain-containing protein 1
LKNYDMSLDDGKERKKLKAIEYNQDSSIIEGFVKAKVNDAKPKVFAVDVPRNFKPRNWSVRRSRFEPLDRSRKKELEEKNRHKVLGLGRHDLRPKERGKILGEETLKRQANDGESSMSSVEPESQGKSLETLKNEEAQKKIQQVQERLKRSQEETRKLTEKLNKQFVSEKNEVFRPFAGNTEKQERYEKFLEFKGTKEDAIDQFLNGIQPLNMSDFDRELEKKEFMQAKKMYRPLDALMADRFIKEVDVQKEKSENVKIDESGKKVIKVIRTKAMWKPHKDLCKRFNVPEPYGGNMFDEEAERKKKRKVTSSLFDYIGVPLNTKSNFVTPQVIPQRSVEQVENSDVQKKKFSEALNREKAKISAKEFFNSEDSAPEKPGESSKDSSQIVTTSTDPPKAPSRWDQQVKPVERTELEIRVIEARDKKPEEKKDLFKSIFCDSDDEDEVKTEEKSEPAANELSENQKSKFIESFLNTKNASEINVLRNTSPPRGLFKSLLGESSLVTPVEKPRETTATLKLDHKQKEPEIKHVFEPKTKEKEKSKKKLDDLDKKLLKKLKKLEKKKLHKKKSKKEKKHKKDKKHKKSKK